MEVWIWKGRYRNCAIKCGRERGGQRNGRKG